MSGVGASLCWSELPLEGNEPMDLLGNAINALVVGTVGLLLAWHMRGRFDAIDRKFEAVEARIDRLDVRVDGLQASIDAMRSDLTQVALAVGARPRATNR